LDGGFWNQPEIRALADIEVSMAVNKPKGNNARKGAVRMQLKGKLQGKPPGGAAGEESRLESEIGRHDTA
jgi:hypothetical protein